ncbi:MAG: hypothetical protein QOF03_1809 [Alphaproteobacteria bacterium]|jgi:hypothetical protein|nr:hypothetical protein [Alphaproteobacteria bacterium]
MVRTPAPGRSTDPHPANNRARFPQFHKVGRLARASRVPHHLIDVHDGTLSLESEVNDGTAVTIFLPAERVERSEALPAVKAITCPLPGQFKIQIGLKLVLA